MRSIKNVLQSYFLTHKLYRSTPNKIAPTGIRRLVIKKCPIKWADVVNFCFTLFNGMFLLKKFLIR
jgi:hypothetical protein